MFANMRAWIIATKDDPSLESAKRSIGALLIYDTEQIAQSWIDRGTNGRSDQYRPVEVEINLLEEKCNR